MTAPRLRPLLLAVLVLALGFGLGSPAGAASRWDEASGPIEIVGSDGSRFAPRNYEWLGFLPSQAPRAVAPGERLDLEADSPDFAETAEEAAAWMNAVPARAPRGVESVIGGDGRVKITNTKTYPASATVHINFRSKGGGSTFLCSGALIARNVVLTAAHCIYDLVADDFYDPNSYVITPGRNGSSKPYGTCKATTIYTNSTWTNTGDDRHDYGAIKLNCNVGNNTGWYGLFWTTANLKNKQVSIQGYPGDKPTGTQWKGSGPITVNQSQRLFYTIDTFGGQSGSGVNFNINLSGQQCNNCVGGIHAYGIYNGPPFSTNNHATRVTQSIFNFFVNIINS